MTAISYDLYRFSFNDYDIEIAYRCKDNRILKESYMVCMDKKAGDTCFSVTPKKDSIRDSFEINLHNIYSNQDKIVQGFAPYMPKFLDFIDTRFSKKATPEDVIYLIKHPDIQFL